MNASQPAMPERWWISVPELSDAFQVGMSREDEERDLWWGNQVVGRAVRRGTSTWWAAIGRDDAPLPSVHMVDGCYPTPDAALVRARDAWRQRPVALSDRLGEDYWIEPRPVAGVESLWLGRIHLGHIRPLTDGTYEAVTTNDELIEPSVPAGARPYPTREEGLIAVRTAWRAHLRRILRITRQPC